MESHQFVPLTVRERTSFRMREALVRKRERRLNHEAFAYYDRLTPVLRYVEANLSKPISLGEAAQAAGLERKYFSAFFRSKVGVPFTEWIRLLRVDRAETLIQHCDDSITRVAFAAGFRELRTFERVFKRHVGVTAREYRASVRPEPRWISRSPRGRPLS